jgi:hypothetical protein
LRQGGEEAGLGFNGGGGARQFVHGGADLFVGQRFVAGKLLGPDVEHGESIGKAGEVC